MTVSLASSLPARSAVPPAESARLSDAQEARWLIDKGRQLRSAGDRANSLAAFRQAVESDPTNATATIGAPTTTGLRIAPVLGTRDRRSTHSEWQGGVGTSLGQSSRFGRSSASPRVCLPVWVFVPTKPVHTNNAKHPRKLPPAARRHQCRRRLYNVVSGGAPSRPAPTPTIDLDGCIALGKADETVEREQLRSPASRETCAFA